MSPPAVLPPETLARAALAVHDLLYRHNFEHVFLGGLQVCLLGSPRGTKDIDVQVSKASACRQRKSLLFSRIPLPLPSSSSSSSEGFENIRSAFHADENFMVFEGTTEQGIRAIWDMQVGIDILTPDTRRIPKSRMYLPLTTPPRPSLSSASNTHNNGYTSSASVSRTLPFLTPTHLLIEKIRTAGIRVKAVDASDILFLYDTLCERLDLSKVKRNLSSQQIEAARTNHPNVLDRVLDRLACP